MIPIDVAINLSSYEKLSLEILKRQILRASDPDPKLDDEIKLLYEARKCFHPTNQTITERAHKLFRIIEGNLPEGIEFTLIFHRFGGKNFIAQVSSAEPGELLGVLEELTLQLRNR